MQEPTMQELRDEKLAGDYRDEMTASEVANYAITAALADVMDHPESYFRVVDGRIVKR